MSYQELVFIVVSGAGRLSHDRPFAAFPRTGEAKEMSASFEHGREPDGSKFHR